MSARSIVPPRRVLVRAKPDTAAPRSPSKKIHRLYSHSHRIALLHVALIPAALPNPGDDLIMADADGLLDAGDMFKDPEGFYEPEPEPTFADHQMHSGDVVRVRLVGSHPLYV